MNKDKSLIAIMANTRVGKNVALNGAKVFVRTADNGCAGCMFMTINGANNCDYKAACMGRYRKDKNSVVFIS